MAGPVDANLVHRARATRNYLVAGTGVGCATAVLTIIQARLLAHSMADVFANRALATVAWTGGWLLVVFMAKGLLAWLNTWLAHRTSAKVKSQLRVDIMAARLHRPLDPGTSTGSLITLVTQGLDALDSYFAKYLPQLLLAVTVPLITGVAIAATDLTSAIIVALTLPLIPVFMILIGNTTAARTRKRWKTQARLANHFADLVAGLPTLQVFSRAKAQARGLQKTEELHRNETVATLRIAFLSAFVLELLATLSVAIIAVSIGFRLVFYGIDLETAFFLLILAPEVYLPVRQVGVHFHDSAVGVAAATQAFTLIDAARKRPGGAATPPDVARAVVELRDFGHTYPGAAGPAVEGLNVRIDPGSIVALVGSSGGGKTTTLNAIMGFLSPTAGAVLVDGQDLQDLDVRAWRQQIAYVGQHPGMIAGTVFDNVRMGYPAATEAQARAALAEAGAPNLPVEQGVGDDGEGLSAGERRRVAMARALIRIRCAGARLMVLDEPTAGLDAGSETTLLQSLRRLQITTVVVSHRPAVIALADAVVDLTRVTR